jgi:hypothetical protein
VEAGAQGEHKIQRGYLPVTTYSCHYFSDPGFGAAIGNFLTRETAQVFFVSILSTSFPPKPWALLYHCSNLCMPDNNLFLFASTTLPSEYILSVANQCTFCRPNAKLTAGWVLHLASLTVKLGFLFSGQYVAMCTVSLPMNLHSIPFFPPPICTRRTAMSFVYENNLLLPSSATLFGAKC